MKKTYKYLFTFIICLFVAPLITKADCSYERQAELSRIAANVRFSYSYITGDSSPAFEVNITNLTNDVYISETEGGEIISGTGEKILIYDSGTNIKFNIYSNDPNCQGEKIMTQFVSIPQYNFLSKYPQCQENPDFKYCQIWANNNLNADEFEKELEEHKKEKNKIETENQEKDMWEIILSFYEQNKMTILLVVTSLIVLIICVLYYRRQRRY